MRLKTILFLAFFGLAVCAHAQVYRCKDSSGKLIFSDRPCEAGQSGGLVLRERSSREIQSERERAYEAEIQKQERQIAAQERELRARQNNLLSRPQGPAARDPGSDWQSRKDRENQAVSKSSITNNGGRFDQEAEAQRAKERQEEARRRADATPMFTHCDPGYCYDQLGRSYHRASSDLLVGNGKTCTKAGETWVCN